MEKKDGKKGMKITNSFNLLTAGLHFHIKKEDTIQQKENENKISQEIFDSSFPNFTKEKEEIEKVQAQILKIAKMDDIKVSQEKKDKKIKEQKEILSNLKTELYKKLKLTASNYDEINPLVSFEEMQKKCKLRKKFIDEIINKHYKFKNPSPIQSVVVPLLIKYKNVVASSETGSGKTLSYLIPCIHNSLLNKLKDKPNKVLIFLPTKELARQIYSESLIFSKFYTENEIKVKYINKGLIESIKKEYSNFLKNNDIFIATPKNIFNLLEICNTDLIDQTLYLVLDEADKFFDYGFAEMVSDILAKYKDKPEVSKCFFSATLLQSLGEIITTQFFDAISISIGLANIPARHIDQEFIYCTNEDGKLIGIRNIFRGKLEFPILIFVEGIKKLKAIYECVKFEIPKISYIHSKMSKKEREEQITKFRIGDTWILICSDLLARGVDFKNVKTVINFDCPYRPVNYIHRIGRTGRAGKSGKAITFVIDDDVPKLKSISRMVNNMKKENLDNIKCPNWLIKLSQNENNNNTTQSGNNNFLAQKRNKLI